jgi:hypothetical protein
MKKISIFSLSFLFVIALFTSCRKSDNPSLPALTRIPLPLVLKDPTGDANISGQNPAAFTGKFTVDVFFPNEKPAKMDAVVIKNGDKTNVKVIQADITTFPTTITVTGTQLANLFGGVPIVAGDNFQVSVDVTTTSGLKIQGFPVTGNAYASGIAAQPGSSTVITYIALCSFVNTAFDAIYTVVRDDWADYAAGETVNVDAGPGVNQISVYAYPSPAYGTNRKPMICNVDPVTFAVTIPEQVIGDYFGSPPNSTASGTGTVNPCGDNITLSVTVKAFGGTYANNVLVLEK